MITYSEFIVEKSLSQRIAKRELIKKKNIGAKNKVAFLALRNDITEALNQGWSIKLAWETLSEEGKISFTYKTFRLYVLRLIGTDKPASPTEINLSSNTHQLPVSTLPKNKTIQPIPTFTFQSQPNPEELF